MTQPGTRIEWIVAAGLILLGLVPVLAGAVRLQELAIGTTTAETDRFHAAPVAVILHIVAASWFALGGAFQFVPSQRRRTRWHRIAGRLLVPAGLVAALSGVWMTVTYPWANADGEVVYLARLIFGAGMALSLILGVTSILCGNVAAHRAWMLRAYAIGMGAGTQVVTHLPWFLLVGQPSESPRAVMMIGAWVINLAVVEWLIRAQGGALQSRAIPAA